jgi:hypothetical protein
LKRTECPVREDFAQKGYLEVFMSELEKLQTAQAEYMAALSAINKIKPQDLSVYFGDGMPHHEVIARIGEGRLAIRRHGHRDDSVDFSLTEGLEPLGCLKGLYEENLPMMGLKPNGGALDLVEQMREAQKSGRPA